MLEVTLCSFRLCCVQLVYYALHSVPVTTWHEMSTYLEKNYTWTARIYWSILKLFLYFQQSITDWCIRNIHCTRADCTAFIGKWYDIVFFCFVLFFQIFGSMTIWSPKVSEDVAWREWVIKSFDLTNYMHIFFQTIILILFCPQRLDWWVFLKCWKQKSGALVMLISRAFRRM